MTMQMPTAEITAEQKVAQRIIKMVESVAKPGPGGIDITGGVPSEIHIAIVRGHFNCESEVAAATAESMRREMADWIRREFFLSEPDAIPLKQAIDPTPRNARGKPKRFKKNKG